MTNTPNKKYHITCFHYTNSKGNGRYDIKIAEELAIDIALGGPMRDEAIKRLVARITAAVERTEGDDLAEDRNDV